MMCSLMVRLRTFIFNILQTLSHVMKIKTRCVNFFYIAARDIDMYTFK